MIDFRGVVNIVYAINFIPLMSQMPVVSPMSLGVKIGHSVQRRPEGFNVYTCDKYLTIGRQLLDVILDAIGRRLFLESFSDRRFGIRGGESLITLTSNVLANKKRGF